MPTRHKEPAPRKWTAAAIVDELVDKYEAVVIDRINVDGGGRLTRAWCRAPRSRVLVAVGPTAAVALQNFAAGEAMDMHWRTFKALRAVRGASNGC